MHLGARSKRDLLREPAPRAALLDRLRDVERLVLLGDVLELRHGPLREALSAAQEVLEAIGASLPAGAEVVIVPGNHDHHLAQPWLARRARKGPPSPLGLESAVDWRAGEVLSTVVRALAPATVRAAYPGVWLREDVYALHGHYGDRHTTVPMFERLGAGVTARVVNEPAGGPRASEDYEAVLAPLYAWIHAVAQAEGRALRNTSRGASAQLWHTLAGGRPRDRKLRRRALAAGFPLVVATLNRTGIGPLETDISGPALRRAGLRAVAEVLARLEVRAPHVIFGHTHRAGPLPPDASSEWIARSGARLINSGSWVHEPEFVGPEPRTSPYRAGFAVWLAKQGPPELRNLIDVSR